MISLKDIRQAVNHQLNVTGIEINSRDVSEGFNRPSFFVQLDNVKTFSTPTHVRRSLTVRIYYFPTERHENSMELLNMQEQIESLFVLHLKVKDRLLNIDDVDSTIIEGVYQAWFDLDFETEHDRDLTQQWPQEKMQELELKVKE